MHVNVAADTLRRQLEKVHREQDVTAPPMIAG